VVCLEVASQHVVDTDLMCKGWACRLQCCLTCAKVMVFIAEVGSYPADLNVELIDFLVSSKKLKVRVHCKASCRCCPRAVLNFVADVA
jgi:hypothetical protein